MGAMNATFRELAAESRVESVPFSHLSIELGHLYMEDFAQGPGRLRAQFNRVAPWTRVAREQLLVDADGQRTDSTRRPRVSTCFLIDDYFTQFSSPAKVLPMLVETARDAGLEIDYIARESACAVADKVPLADMVAGHITPQPPSNTNGSRPPVLESGWLCNGQRSPGNEGQEAMRRQTWMPPSEIDARNHSVFVDVELWHDRGGQRLYSCPYLASIWQLLRLGMLRYEGATVVRPQNLEGDFPQQWDELPPIVQLRPGAAPFCAYRTFSVLPSRFLQVETAVRVILNHVTPNPEILKQITERAARDGGQVSSDVTDRVEYAFFNNR